MWNKSNRLKNKNITDKKKLDLQTKSVYIKKRRGNGELIENYISCKC